MKLFGTFLGYKRNFFIQYSFKFFLTHPNIYFINLNTSLKTALSIKTVKIVKKKKQMQKIKWVFLSEISKKKSRFRPFISKFLILPKYWINYFFSSVASNLPYYNCLLVLFIKSSFSTCWYLENPRGLPTPRVRRVRALL